MGSSAIELSVDAAGWVGAFLIVLAYYRISTQRTSGTSLGYQGLNAGGSILVGGNALYYGALPSVFINIVWISIALAALLSIMRKKR